MARVLNLGNVIAKINGNRLLNVSATQPVNWAQNGYDAVISVPNASQASAGLMSSIDKTKLDAIQANSVALGETSTTSYRGDRGKAAYDHSLVVTGNPHHVTKAEVGLSNVPNVATNDQTPTYTPSVSLSSLVSGEKLEIALGKLATTTETVISHTSDTVIHITAAERGSWNNKVDKVSGKALSTNDFTNDYKSKLDGIEAGAEVNEIYAADHGLVAGAVKVLQKQIDDLKNYCSHLEKLLANNVALETGICVGKKGFGYIDDADTPKPGGFKIKVDSSYAGSQLYIQCVTISNSSSDPMITQTTLNQYKVDQYGEAETETSITYGAGYKSYIFVTTSGYVWNISGSSSGTAVVANTGAFGQDGYPTNGIDFELQYTRASSTESRPTQSRLNESVFGYYDVMALNGYAPKLTKYSSVDAAIAGYNNGDTVVIEDRSSLDYLLQSNYWLNNRWVRLSTIPSIPSYTGDYYKEEMVPAV